MELQSKFRGALLGTAIGDSLGRRLEGTSKLRTSNVKDLVMSCSKLRYTDDTQMMIGVAESLVGRGEFDGKHMAQRFVENFDPLRGYGPGSTRVIHEIKRGETWNSPAKKLFGGSGSYGNGSSMRIAPIGLFYHDDFEQLYSIAKASSRITHTHELGVEGAALQACAVGLATNADPNVGLPVYDFVEKIQDFVKSEEYRRKLRVLEEFLKEGATNSEVVHELGNGIEAFNSVPTAIYSFLSNLESFESAVIYAIDLGGDTDTIGAMTGAISGAYHGSERISSKWKEKLEDRDRIIQLADKLFEIKT
ncbi:hypothetical protein AKJ42_02425 [candidate division MSBL1 archaeon SCGC-AAA261C02]|uniref:ADP-ribosylglycohydrolase n=1 Tax=candidate division MSBL1 archaeon SCGC-AAA261C02 TaxID=1698272 RepID=A0A133V065_9EURY|nr:hypothetical protein AKJ42_02425 [candidate division MSBL1 archaeon SCGC-AAA261C02]